MIKSFKKIFGEGLFKDSLFVAISNIYSKFMAYIFYFITAIFLGTESFGLLRGLLPLLDVFTIFFCSGIPPSMAKHISEDGTTNWTVDILKVMFILSIVGALLLILSKNILGGGYKQVSLDIYLVLGVAIILSSIISWSRGVLQGLLKIKVLSLTWIIESSLKVLSLPILIIMYGVLGPFISISVGYALSGIYGILKLSSIISFKNITSLKINIQMVKKILFYGVPIALSTASYRLLNDLDSMFIMALLGSYENGLYGYPSLLSRGAFLFAFAISVPLVPRIAKSKDINDFKKSIILNFIAILPLIIIFNLFPSEILKLFFGVVNLDSSFSLRILSISAGFMSSYTLCSSALQGLGRAEIPLYVLIIGILINGILNYALIPIYGIIGGAIATLISSIFIFIGVFIGILKYYKDYT